jgi:hypothetical protein
MSIGEKLLEDVGFKKKDNKKYENKSGIAIIFSPIEDSVIISDPSGCTITITGREVSAIDARFREVRYDLQRESL